MVGAALASTFIVCVLFVPVHPLKTGVMMKFTFCGIISEFTGVTAGIRFPPDAEGQPAVMPASQLMIHEKFVPATFDDSVTGADEFPEQISCDAGDMITFATGFTVTV
jgi:hypothetical protein